MRVTVRRCLAAAVAIVAVAAVWSLDLPRGGPAVASAVTCDWHKHRKKIRKKVKRHGKVRRVVRFKIWWTCDPVATPGDVGVGGGGSTGGGSGTPAHYLGVRAWEYAYLLSRPNVTEGQVTVELNNMGEDPHDLNIRLLGSSDSPDQIPLTESLDRASAVFDLTPGTYRMWCDLPDHDALGMHATLLVDPAR